MARIVLKKPSPKKHKTGSVVRLSPKALAVVQRMQDETGLSAQKVVSEILIQAESMIDVKED